MIRKVIPFPRNWAEWRRTASELRRRRYDLIIDLQGLFRSGLLGMMAGGRTRAGFASAREGSRWAYTQRVPVPEEVTHAVDRYLYLVRCLRHKQRNNGADLSGDPVWILDSMGELSAAYALGTVAFVGGSFVKRGGHNLLEPAAWSKPVFFGPHVDNFSDIASTLQSAGGGMMVRDGDELASRIEELVSNKPRLEEMGRRACSFVTLNQTAVDKNLDIIQTLVKERENSSSLPGMLKRAGNIRT